MKKKGILAVLSLLLLLTGCWDSRQIEKFSIAIGLGVDKGEGDKKVKLSYQILVPKKIGQNAGSEDPTKVVSTSGTTIHQTIRSTALKVFPVFSQHLQVIIFSEKLVSDIALDALINQFIRDNSLRRSSEVYITPGSPSKLLNIDDSGDPASEIIHNVSENRASTIKLLEPVTLGDISIRMQMGLSFIMPRVVEKGGQIQVDGGSVIKKNRYYADISSSDIEALNLLIGRVNGGVIDSRHKGHLFSYEIFSMNHRIHTTRKNGKYKFDIHSEIKGRLSEDWYRSEDSFNESYINAIEKAIEKDIHQRVSRLLHRLQDDLKTDVTKLAEYARINYPKEWQKDKYRWDEKFSEADIDYHIKAIIQDFGTKGAKKKR
ncbi:MULTISPECIES: Ger(x)C family spore germination protein [Bacillus]|uniref:Ger(X)C family spore germination protein n=1 Tax=Bacillus glycinifermentans TaxID=1664069 RepID=A0AAJ4D3X9_9BACI|nr:MULTISPECIES: Ger(x)C family spore germination protein [Bacillus]KKB75435.1 spore gernimation protein [Bacillus sp. TH008]MDU0070568.1 Ger(x)C family spore germination protein [Bacillus sp. IG6]MED8018432.1 Ger(x)C family spore germination protein [Bacillus glycinifermentans]QAT66898.1 Ger(x)C family spore germination protein [Bacillus glycinifermentans]WKB76602.1 Ger(x)C family spore germination protein [Bacillus glycinifermentans]